MYKILISDKFGQAGLNALDALDDVTYDVKTGLSKEELIDIIGDYDALIVRSGTRPDADIIAAGKKLKVIGRAGVGVDNIDIDAATQHGVRVMNTPDANSIATAEQTLTLMLALNRHTVPAHNSLAAGNWDRAKYAGTELYQKTLGIIGFGRIGRLVSQRARAFGMTIIAYDPYVSAEAGTELGVEMVELGELYGRADLITLHTVSNAHTKGMVNAQAISQMKDGVMLINVARGTLINEADLAQALQDGKIRAAAIDVYSIEPPSADNPLLNLPNVLHTPHLGASTAEAQTNVATQMVSQVVDALRGTAYRNVLNQVA